MKSHGDIPENDRLLVEQLTLQEAFFRNNQSDLPLLLISMGLVCIAHDYYCMDMEEQGDRLLFLADEYCPGYFAGPIISHLESDLDFYYLVEGLKKTMALEVMAHLGFKK